MAKPKAKKKTEVVKDDAIAITPKNGDRYTSKYGTWLNFVDAEVPEDKYPLMRLRK